MTLCLLASHVALAVWTGLAYRNLFALGVGDLRFAPGWGVWAWFVPFLNFVRPKQIVDDLWRSTTPGDAWPRPPVPGMLHVWWALVLLTSLFAPAGIVGAALMVASSGLTWWVTAALTNRLDSLAAGRGHSLQPAPTRRGLRSLLVVSGLAAVGIAAVAPLPEIAMRRPTHVAELEIGDCFGGPTPSLPTPGDEVATVDVVSCDEPHAYELIDVIVHDAPPGATYPGQERLFQFGAEQCVEHFEEIVGKPFMQSELDVFMYVPTADGWRDGDRDIQCMALRIDGGPLEGTVVGSGQ